MSLKVFSLSENNVRPEDIAFEYLYKTPKEYCFDLLNVKPE